MESIYECKKRKLLKIDEFVNKILDEVVKYQDNEEFLYSDTEFDYFIEQLKIRFKTYNKMCKLEI